MKKLSVVIALAMVAAFAFSLVGCGGGNGQQAPSNQSEITISTRDGEKVTMTIKELSELSNDNPVAFEEYLGCHMEATAPVTRIRGEGYYDNYKVNGGIVTLDEKLDVEFPVDEKDIVASLNTGDIVHATGNITGNLGGKVWCYINGYNPNHIEKA